jgi:hypothetical protein
MTKAQIQTTCRQWEKLPWEGLEKYNSEDQFKKGQIYIWDW